MLISTKLNIRGGAEGIFHVRPLVRIPNSVTARKDIMDIYSEERGKLYAYFKNISC
jgi:hypothetical protein